jgi:hypothetical protein
MNEQEEINRLTRELLCCKAHLRNAELELKHEKISFAICWFIIVTLGVGLFLKTRQQLEIVKQAVDLGYAERNGNEGWKWKHRHE